MTKHGYGSGRLDLPFVGIAHFAKFPIVADWATLANLKPNAAVLGAHFDAGTRAGRSHLDHHRH